MKREILAALAMDQIKELTEKIDLYKKHEIDFVFEDISWVIDELKNINKALS